MRRSRDYADEDGINGRGGRSRSRSPAGGRAPPPPRDRSLTPTTREY